ncbi:hypothetical protein NP493_866g01061 [Ridgeia piscesae]|uniref:A disintegrin and metalloproteinase with thrombospondin motifs 6 n=1 Tax=Ridgeia piscesae TaxID=27915 RepID=A0AAD9KLW9_RIDPI|nr:hypothetical protein NP493_866g01061 [Ridgeia piscesae]
MCESDRSCSINEDIGLASAFTIAHEMGHNFGMQHDGAGNKCGTRGHEGAKIMASQLTKNTDPFTWSSCSREYITSFLDAGRGKCLEETPSDEDFIYPDVLPGESHDGDAQCRYQYGSQSMQCRKEEVCRELWCLNAHDQCVTNNIPAASGTECATQKLKKGWCLRGKCVKYHWRPKSTDGKWGPWTGWTECSRTCDGGVKVSERHCDSPRPTNGGKYCIGERRRYRSCHIEECPRKATDFRAEQCSKFDEIPFRGKFYKWKSYSGVGQLKPCALNCLAEGYNFYTERAPKVIDGTRCYPDSVDMCINGECMHVGCDHLLGSDAVEDKCRVCGGDGSTCESVTVTYDKPLKDMSGDSYVKVAVIPQGAMHIKITEDVISRNYLALKASEGEKYYINGAWTIDWPRKFEVANTVFHYERSNKKPESLTALGPTSEDLVLMLLLQERNKGVTYTYTMLTPNVTANNVTVFVWEHTAWSECSASCAGGVTKSTAVCTRKDDRTIVQNDLCSGKERLSDLVKFCNKQPCPAEWSIGDWSECSVTCSGGIRSRTVMCLRKVGHRKSEVVKHTQCEGKRPKSRMRCNMQRCPTHWATGAWSSCHPKCGDAIKKRSVYCVSAEGRYMQESHCDATKRPQNRRKCQQPPCPPPSWVVGAWHKCSSRCGKGRQRRTVICRTHRGRRSAACDPDKKPAMTRACQGQCLRRKAEECRDVAKVTYCPLVLKFNFCKRPYFRQMCCKTCSKAGL